MVGETIRAMSLEGFNVLVGFGVRDSLLRFDSPCNCYPSLMFGIGNSRGNTVSLVQPCMDTVPLLVWVKVKGCKTHGGNIQLIHICLDSHVNDGIHSTIAIRAGTGCTNILESNVLIKGLGKFVLGSLL